MTTPSGAPTDPPEPGRDACERRAEALPLSPVAAPRPDGSGSPDAAASPRLAAVVVHYGDPAPTRRCVESLAGIDEVILVDQTPTACGRLPGVTVHIEPRTNLGFAGACNRGVAAARAPWVLLVNNDAELEPGAVDALLEALPSLDAAPDVAGACLKLLCLDGATLQSAGGLYFTRDLIGFPNGFGERDEGQYDLLAADRIGVPSGAAALYRTSAWRGAGGMATEFFCYCEDGDLGLRIVAAGGGFAWLPSVRVRHALSASTGAHSRPKAFHVERNHFLTAIHVAPGRELAMLPWWTVVRLARTGWDAMRGRGAGAEFARSLGPVAMATTLLAAWAEIPSLVGGALHRRRALFDAASCAPATVRRFLAGRRAPASAFRQRRA